MNLQAIETHYAGCRFRSRIEARWAVFYDAMGIAWEYEPEGFDTPSGPYLPDFRTDGRVYVEIKGTDPTQYDLDRCRDAGAIIFVGDIPRTPDDFKWLRYSEGAWHEWDQSMYWPLTSDGMYADRKSLATARSARFEHGESGPARPHHQGEAQCLIKSPFTF